MVPSLASSLNNRDELIRRFVSRRATRGGERTIVGGGLDLALELAQLRGRAAREGALDDLATLARAHVRGTRGVLGATGRVERRPLEARDRLRALRDGRL